MIFFLCYIFGGSRVGVSSLPTCRFYRVENFRSLVCIEFLINLLDLFSECKNYQILSSADRKMTHGGFPRLCDNNIGPGWFRLQGDAGVKMPTSCIPLHRCGTDIPGWLNGNHPEEHEGNVTRQVCFHYNSCCEFYHNIQVRNCGGYYVYYLRGTICYARYCGTD